MERNGEREVGIINSVVREDLTSKMKCEQRLQKVGGIASQAAGRACAKALRGRKRLVLLKE